MSNECRLRLEWVPEAYKEDAGLSDKSFKKQIAGKSSSMLYCKSKTKTVYGWKSKNGRVLG